MPDALETKYRARWLEYDLLDELLTDLLADALDREWRRILLATRRNVRQDRDAIGECFPHFADHHQRRNNR
jgi:hypothetical protein